MKTPRIPQPSLADLESLSKTDCLFIRLSAEAKQVLTGAAREDGRSVSEWVRRTALRAALKGGK